MVYDQSKRPSLSLTDLHRRLVNKRLITTMSAACVPVAVSKYVLIIVQTLSCFHFHDNCVLLHFV